MAKELARELDSKSREFFEFVMPAIDMAEDGNELVVVIDVPGFAKKGHQPQNSRKHPFNKRQEGAGRVTWDSLLQAQAAQDRQENSPPDFRKGRGEGSRQGNL